MTAKLAERLARLEAQQAKGNGKVHVGPDLIGTFLEAVAIALGGYPRPPQVDPPYRIDNLSDGFARGLGYLDRNDMEAGLEADPDEWQHRLSSAERTLCEKYVTDPRADPDGWNSPSFQVWVGVMDEIGRAAAARLPGEAHYWPREYPRLDATAKSIRRAFAHYDIPPEQCEAACARHST